MADETQTTALNLTATELRALMELPLDGTFIANGHRRAMGKVFYQLEVRGLVDATRGSGVKVTYRLTAAGMDVRSRMGEKTK